MSQSACIVYKVYRVSLSIQNTTLFLASKRVVQVEWWLWPRGVYQVGSCVPYRTYDAQPARSIASRYTTLHRAHGTMTIHVACFAACTSMSLLGHYSKRLSTLSWAYTACKYCTELATCHVLSAPKKF